MSESPIEPDTNPDNDPQGEPTEDPEIVPASDPDGGSTVLPVEPSVTNPDADGIGPDGDMIP